MTVAARTIDVNGVATHLYDAGTGEVPVICVHGNPDTGDSWLRLLGRADGELGRVIAPDLPGWGRSPAPPRSLCDGSLDALAAWFDALLDVLAIQSFHLVVHDWGSIALPAAARRAEDVPA